MRPLLTMIGLFEAVTGVALLLSPSVTVSLLIGAPADTPAGLVVTRVAGAALLALGVACWLARSDGQSRTTAGVVTAMLLYNFVAATLLAYAGLGVGLAGIGLWPAVVLHIALAGWCVACLWSKSMKRARFTPSAARPFESERGAN